MFFQLALSFSLVPLGSGMVPLWLPRGSGARGAIPGVLGADERPGQRARLGCGVQGKGGSGGAGCPWDGQRHFGILAPIGVASALV